MWQWSAGLLLGLAAWQPPQEPAKTKTQPPAAQAAATAPARPAPSLFPEGYLDHAALTAALRRVVDSSGGKARLTSLARTREGRDVWMASVGPPAASAQTPAILIVANLEADHLVGSQVALGILEKVARDPAWAKRLATSTLHVIPRLNPDGAERLLRRPRGEFRTNLTPVDRDRDGKSGEDGPDDLNGDGLLTMMRAKDGRATLVPDPADPRLLKKADASKGERPIYSEYTEGIDDDGDGQVNEDPPGGVNLNRNWPQRWPENDPEAGFSPAAEPETRALIAFAFDHPEIAVVWSLGLNDNLAVAPKKPEASFDSADLPIFVELSRLYNKAAAAARPRREKPAVAAPAAPGATTDGSLVEWAYHQYGAVGLASRLWEGPEVGEAKPEEPGKPTSGGTAPAPAPAAAKRPAVPGEGEARWLYWNDHVMGGRAFVPFAPFDHPTLGKVEVGGWKPGVRFNPPIEQLETIAKSSLAFLGDVADRLPRLAIRDVKVVAKGKGVYQVEAAVVNEGGLPTALAQGVQNRKAPPVRLRLDPGPARLLAGQKRVQFDSLGGSGGRREFRWLVLAPRAEGEGAKPPAATLSVSSPKAGSVVQAIPLEATK